ncbi:L-ribulose-5-phosphate 4-epimerase AraD [Conexibacter sp. CPCC 206217]|uniref:L-ribulose-5-phosphate 4-epimerase AraD n=1 Tax=Conexibacter sp. CPCC 206217 TaxID=3064574 RepID=UPI00271D8E9C|nr:L-ribulose-5-phosphate 4-epimerase AraD [Conexibacter sp. CPCC 206217]MDO8213168.1 L-ribulose-5-phosphate 4-epimerase AraD [Conexibacter sp. CPCC 206217]
MLEQLRDAVLEANLALTAHGLVTLTWGNASGIDRERGLVVIKASGVPYASMSAADLAVVTLDGEVVEGGRPSTDTPTHLALYAAFEELGGVVHTHSTWATAWAQATREIPVLGTTHADFSPFPVPVARELTASEVDAGYEASTGAAIVDAVGDRCTAEVPGVLLPWHGPFAWGATPAAAVENAVTLEQVARVALLTERLRPQPRPIPGPVLAKHFERKHGPRAYYGQR